MLDSSNTCHTDGRWTLLSKRTGAADRQTDRRIESVIHVYHDSIVFVEVYTYNSTFACSYAII